MARLLLFSLFSVCCTLIAEAQQAVVLPQQSLSRWNIGTAHFSGITPLGNHRYALVSDKEPEDGFFVVRIEQHPNTGKVSHVELESFRGVSPTEKDGKGYSLRDAEGVAFVPQTQTLWISGEGDQQILEHRLDGGLTGRSFHIPTLFHLSNIAPNRGFEALTCDSPRQLFWLTTESPLLSDCSSPDSLFQNPLLRFQSFDFALQPHSQHLYPLDPPRVRSSRRPPLHGVSALCALPDGRLVVMEREVLLARRYFGSLCSVKLYCVDPRPTTATATHPEEAQQSDNRLLSKTLLATWTTRFGLFRNSLANYEGMCLGIRLPDGRQTLICINDSQAAWGKGPFRLHDYLRVIILPPDF